MRVLDPSKTTTKKNDLLCDKCLSSYDAKLPADVGDVTGKIIFTMIAGR